MARSSRHPREARERAVALVLETQSDYGSQWEAIAPALNLISEAVPGPGRARDYSCVQALIRSRDSDEAVGVPPCKGPPHDRL